MVRGSCPSVTHRFVVLAHAHFLSTAIPVAYRWVKRLNSHSPHPWQTPASSFKSLYRKRANAPCSCVQLAHSRFRYNTKTHRELTHGVLELVPSYLAEQDCFAPPFRVGCLNKSMARLKQKARWRELRDCKILSW